MTKSLYLGIFWLVLITAPFWIAPLGGYTGLASRVIIIGLAAMATNILVGHSGVMAFGHAAYFGVAAYATGLTMEHIASNTLLGILAGIIMGTLAGIIVGFLLRKLRGIYFALATIAIGQVFYFIAFRWNSVTGGDNGLTFHRQPIHLGFADINIASSSLTFYFTTLVVFAICTAAMAVILKSPFGRTLLGMRENERRATFLSIPVNHHLWLAYSISCLFVSVAGCLYALLNNFVSPGELHWMQSGYFVLMAVIGGMRSFWGPLLGAAIFVIAQDYLSSITQNWMFFIGALFVVVVLVLPRGIAGLLQRRTA